MPDCCRARRVPASTTKLLTAVAAMLELPPDARVDTTLVRGAEPDTLVVAGGAFVADPAAPKLFASAVRQACPHPTELRLIPAHTEIVRACTRAVALDPLLRVPLELGREAKAA